MIKKRSKEFSTEDLKAYMALPAKEKMQRLYRMNEFLRRIRPKRNKKITEALKKRGL